MANDEKDDAERGVEGDAQTDTGRTARIAGTALAAVGSLAIIVLASAVLFITIAGLLRSDWLAAVIGAVVFVLLLFLLGRMLRVAANQNKDPMG